MNRINTNLPEVRPPQPPKVDWFSKHYLWGYAFLAFAFILAIAFIYQVQYGKKPKESQICIQVITPAKNTQTGEVRDFPTPCDVPEGWEPVQNNPNELNYNLSGEYRNEKYAYSLTYDENLWNISATSTPEKLSLYPEDYYEGVGFTISVSTKPLSQVIAEEKASADQSLTKDTKVTTVQMAGVTWTKITYSVDIGGVGNIFITRNNNFTYVIDTEDHEYFNELVQSFKFIDNNLYINKELGFQLALSGAKLQQVLNDQYNKLVSFLGPDLNFEVKIKSTTETANYSYLDQTHIRTSFLSNKEALVFEFPNGYCDGPGCSTPFISYVIFRGSDAIHLTFYNDVKISPLEQKVIENFKLIE